jgi:hypothetical protein
MRSGIAGAGVALLALAAWAYPGDDRPALKPGQGDDARAVAAYLGSLPGKK